MSATETRDAVLSALRIAGVDLASGGRTALPTARTRAAVDRLCDATPEKLAAERVDLREVIRSLLDWDKPRATKAVVRTAGRAMTAQRADGAPMWPQAIEALSYAALWAPLLEPDRLERVIAHATAEPTSAFAPIRYAAEPAAKLARLVGHYGKSANGKMSTHGQARLETLAITLWDAAHMGRWWDVCGGLGATEGRRCRRRRRTAEEMEARTAAICRLTGEPAEALSALIYGTGTHWTPATAESLRQLRLTGAALTEAVSFAEGDHQDPDVNILLAQLVDLPPASRPANPVPAMIDALEFLLDDKDPAAVLPKKPTGWGMLYPEGSLHEFPIPAVVQTWDWAEVPGCAGATIELIRSPHVLFENRDFMGNCTGGYRSSCETGNYVLTKIHYNGALYNGSIRCNSPVEPWMIDEINSRFNSGNVPTELREGFGAWVRELNAGRRPGDRTS